jgi:hypothetical protein
VPHRLNSPELVYQLSKNDMTELKYANPHPETKFWLGKFFMTAPASRTLDMEDVLIALKRHHTGDWGDLCEEDIASNEQAMQNGGRLFSTYHDPKGVKFWIITEADRSATTVLLPEDY